MKEKYQGIILLIGVIFFVLGISFYFQFRSQIYFQNGFIFNSIDGDNPTNLEVHDNLIYITNDAGLEIYEVNLTNQIHKLGSINLINNEFTSITIDGEIAYLTNPKTGLYLYNISNPLSPFFVSQFYNGGNASRIVIKGNIGYLADGVDGVKVLDITDIYNICEISQYNDNQIESNPTEGGFSYDLEYIESNGQKLLFVADWEDGVEIINVTDSNNPIEINEIAQNILVNQNLFFRDIEYNNGLIYVSNLNGTLIFDVRDYNNPKFVANIASENDRAYDIELSNGKLLIAFGIDGFSIYNEINISSLWKISLNGRFTIEDENLPIDDRKVIDADFFDNENYILYLTKNSIASVEISRNMGEISLEVLLPISFLLIGFVIYIANKERKIKGNYEFIRERRSLYGLSSGEVKKFIRRTKHHLDYYNLHPYAQIMIQRFISTKDELEFEMLLLFYSVNVKDLANYLIKGEELNSLHKSKLIHEANLEIRNILERHLPEDHPVLREINESLVFLTKNGYKILK